MRFEDIHVGDLVEFYSTIGSSSMVSLSTVVNLRLDAVVQTRKVCCVMGKDKEVCVFGIHTKKHTRVKDLRFLNAIGSLDGVKDTIYEHRLVTVTDWEAARNSSSQAFYGYEIPDCMGDCPNTGKCSKEDCCKKEVPCTCTDEEYEAGASTGGGFSSTCPFHKQWAAERKKHR